jgi:hypothetical protein
VATDEAIAALCLAQLARWHSTPLDRRSAHDVYHALNQSDESLFLFEFAEGQVRIVDKPHYSPEQMATNAHEFIRRAKSYADFFTQTITTRSVPYEGIVAMSMHDGPFEHPDLPFFAFQKKTGSNAILLPDIDAIDHDFYANNFEDSNCYEEKSCSAIFVGATTGAVHTVASVAAHSNPRLRAGLFFKDKPEVDFRLPSIVQCETEEAAEAIRQLGFGTGWASWDEMFRHKFLLSLDGNGATCSRVAIALKSNSVLIKFASVHELYYFPALIPYLHYIPVARNEDVLTLIKSELAAPGLFVMVAEIGRNFFDKYM